MVDSLFSIVASTQQKQNISCNELLKDLIFNFFLFSSVYCLYKIHLSAIALIVNLRREDSEIAKKRSHHDGNPNSKARNQ